MSISSAARPLLCASASSGRLRIRGRSVIAGCVLNPSRCKRDLSPKSRKAALARIPFLADLILDRQAGRGGGAVLGVFFIRRCRLRDALNEMVDDGLLAPCVLCVRSGAFAICVPPEPLLVSIPEVPVTG